jgi:hypothetical protein
MVDQTEWEQRVAGVWREASDGGVVVSRIDALADERPVDDPVALYERASARDFAGRAAEAELLYRRALSLGLADADRRRAVEATVQLASTLRLLERPGEAVAVIDGARVQALAEEQDWLRAFKALALLDSDRAEEAAVIVLRAFAGHLTQYGEAVRRYTSEARSSR